VGDLAGSEYERASVQCRCGRRKLFDLLDHPDGRMVGPPSMIEIDCPWCQYRLWLYFRSTGAVDKAASKQCVGVVHTVDLDRGRVMKTEIWILAEGERVERPYEDLSRALAGAWQTEEGDDDPDEVSEPPVEVLN